MRKFCKLTSWPTDPIHAAAIVQEESGELTRAAVQYIYAGEPKKELYKEAKQTAAVSLRYMLNFEKFKK